MNGTSLGKRCNPSSIESKFVSSSGFDIYFRSDFRLNAAGFVAIYLISDSELFFILCSRKRVNLKP